MKTVIIDKSLCLFPLDETAKPELIYKYIQALGETGVKYAELDFRTIMRMGELPDGIGYIFNVFDHRFEGLAEAFDFDYTVVPFSILKCNIRVKTPAIVQFPALMRPSAQVLHIAEGLIHGKIGMVRLEGDFPIMAAEEAAHFAAGLRNHITVPIDICPTNNRRTALDTALKLTAAGIDSVTMSMGMTNSFVSFEEFLFSLMSVFGTLPDKFSMAGLCKAAIYHKLIFAGRKSDSITDIMRMLDYNINHLINADTGERVKMRVTLRESQLLNRTFVSVLEQFLDSEDMPDDMRYDIESAIQHYDMGLFNRDILNTDIRNRGFSS